MKIVCVSDTHLRHDFKVPDGDLLIHAGDLTMKGDRTETERALLWLASLPHRHKVFIAGNHDFYFQSHPAEARALIQTKVDAGLVYLQDSEATVGGLRIYGSPWQPWFYDWAFNLKRGPEIREKWRLIPEGLDILVTHGPPHGILDWNSDGRRVGCEELLKAIEEKTPRYHIFGHIHEASGTSFASHRTKFVNACICDKDYKPVHKPVIIETA